VYEAVRQGWGWQAVACWARTHTAFSRSVDEHAVAAFDNMSCVGTNCDNCWLNGGNRTPPNEFTCLYLAKR
jgi:hypothetical protein